MIKFIIVTGQKHFFKYVAQSNYLIIQIKLLTAFLKNNIETIEYSKFVTVITGKTVLFIQFSTRIASWLFLTFFVMFIQSIKLYTFH